MFICMPIPFLIPLITTGIKVAANAIGSHIANKRKINAENEYNSAMQQQISSLDEQIEGNYLDSAEAQNALRKMTDSNTETLRQLNTDAIRGGATDEAKVAMASQLNKRTADLTGDLATIGEQKKERLQAEKREAQNQMAEHKYKVNSDTSGIDNILGSIGTAAQTLGAAFAGGASSNVSDSVAAAKTFMDNANTTISSSIGEDPLKYLNGGQFNNGR